MGQYFVVVNLDRREYITPMDGTKATGVCSGETGKLIAYLLLDGKQDGTRFISKNADPDSVTEEDLEEYDWIADRHDDDEEKRNQDISRSIESRKEISEANKYAGRWAGDRITISGDYGVSRKLVPEDLEEELHDKMLEHQLSREGVSEEQAEKYAESNTNLYHAAGVFFDEITEEAYEEFREFMGENYEPDESVLRPDMVLTTKPK